MCLGELLRSAGAEGEAGIHQTLGQVGHRLVVAAINAIAEAAAESAPAHAADELRCLLVHARIPIDEVRNFWEQVQEVARQFAQIPRAGDQVYGFVAGPLPHRRPHSPRRRRDTND